MSHDDANLIASAIEGDHVALQKLLISRAVVLRKFADRKLPAVMRDRVDTEDIVQQVYVEAFRSIHRFRLDEADSFQAWLLKVAEHVINDVIKHHQRVKRGGKFHRVRPTKTTESQSVADLVDLLSAEGHSPSQSAMGHEAVAALTEAINALPDDNRRAVQLRLLEGKSLEETASLMNRSPRAVQGLVDRAKKKMRAVLGRLSKYRWQNFSHWIP